MTYLNGEWVRYRPLLFISAVIALFSGVQAIAAEFSKASDCVVGTRVLNRDNQAGVIASADGSSCRVKLDATGKIDYNIFWMLRPESTGPKTTASGAGAAKASAEVPPSISALTVGVYKCYTLVGSTLNYAFIDIHINAGNRYRDNHGKDGSYAMDGGNTIRFTGPLSAASAKLLPGNRIGLNMTGGNFYNTSCSISR